MAAPVGWCRTHFGRERCQCDRIARRLGAAYDGARALGRMGGREAQTTPLEVAEQPLTTAIPLPIAGWMGLPTTLVAPTTAGAVQPVMTLLMQVEVATVMIDGSQPCATTAVLEAPA